MADLEKYVDLLDKNEDFQVLRRLSVPERYCDHDPAATIYIGVFIDLETTGLDTALVVLFQYLDGRWGLKHYELAPL